MRDERFHIVKRSADLNLAASGALRKRGVLERRHQHDRTSLFDRGRTYRGTMLGGLRRTGKMTSPAPGSFRSCERLRSKPVWTLTHRENRPCGYPVDMLRITPWRRCCAFSAPMKKRSARRNGRQTFTETGDSLLALRILRPLRLGVCGEFSDYSLEGFGWPSARTRLDRRPDALCQHPDFKRYRLDQSNQTLGRARP
jgi:hypothetical protein